MEITRLKWDAENMLLSGTATRPQGETGNLFVLMPPGYRLVNHEGHWLMKDSRDGCVVIRKELHFSKEKMSWRMTFEELKIPSAAE